MTNEHQNDDEKQIVGNKKRPRIFDFYPLEDRVLLSGEGLDGAEVSVDPDAEISAALMADVDADGEAAENPAVAAALVSPAGNNEEHESKSSDLADMPTFDPALPLEVIFVDAGVDDADTLLDGLRGESDDTTQWLIVELDADRDGIEQITDALSGLSGVDAVHILSHGDGDGLVLGNARLDVDSAEGYAGDLASWATSLDPDADLLIYGCDLASTAEGRALIDSIAALCDCDVAASDDATGHEDLGGDWDLEYLRGDIESSIAFSSEVRATWKGLLGDTGFRDPTATGDDHNQWSNASNAYASDDAYASVTSNGQQQDWYNFGFTVPSGAIIDGIEVYVEGNDQLAANGVAVEVSWDGGATYTSTGAQQLWPGSGTDVRRAFGGGDDTWGRTWSESELSNSNFRVRLTKIGSSNVVNFDVDQVRVNVYYTETTFTKTFQEGDANGYTGTQDTYLNEDSPTSSFGTQTFFDIDLDINGGNETVGLIQFDNLFGSGSNQIPLGATITSASLTLNNIDEGDGAATLSFHQMLSSWSETSTWNSMGGGLVSGTDYVAAADATYFDLSSQGTCVINNLEDAVQSWSDGTSNFGWALFNNNSNGVEFDSSEDGNVSLRPELSVTYTYTPPAPAAGPFVVDTTSDVSDGDTSSYAALMANKGADGRISLREAIDAANRTPNSGGPDEIHFNISTSDSGYVDPDAIPANGDEYWVIAPTSFLGYISDPVILDATTQPGYDSGTGRPVIEIDMSGTASATAGLVLRTSDSTISGFAVHGSPDEGIEIDGSTGFGDNNTIENNWVGIDAEGNVSGNTEHGLMVIVHADNNTIRNNVSVASGMSGLIISGYSLNNTVQGNYFGLGPDGVTVMANSDHGILISQGSEGNQIGGATAGQGNVISGNTIDGVSIDGAHHNVLEGNFIGTDSTGTLDRGNADDGVDISSAATGNYVGTSTAGARNIISGNAGSGVYMTDLTTAGNLVHGNYIGTDITGTANLGNGAGGADSGVRFYQSGANSVGGAGAGEGNLIAYNGRYGVEVGTTSNGITILGNSIFSNDQIGIDLDGGTENAFQVTANDAGDGDSGANDLQNSPVFTTVSHSLGTTTVNFDLDWSGAAKDFRIEFYVSDLADPSGSGEGQTLVHSAVISHTGSGNESFVANFSTSAAAVITATATEDFGGGNYGNTSEFSAVRNAQGGYVLVVDTTSDVADGTTTSITNLLNNRGGDGRISLREAIEAANDTAGFDIIQFDISTSDSGYVDPTPGAPGSGDEYWSIALGLTSFEQIDDAIFIDGTTQQSYAGAPVIEIDGSGTSSNDGFHLRAGSDGSTIRGLVINGFDTDGIDINGSDGNTIQGNYIGTNITGDAAIGNTSTGINIRAGSMNNVIGGAAAGEGNLISGNGIGILISGASDNTIAGNIIGTDLTGTIDLGNGSAGIRVSGVGSDDNTIGGTLAAEGNVIAFNDNDGVQLQNGSGTGNSILGNSIYSNSQLGIDLHITGRDSNDSGDGDSGANNRQNYPVITNAETNGINALTLAGALDTDGLNQDYRVEFFASSVADSSGNGEAERYLGYVDVTTDGSGDATFNTVIMTSVAVGEFITATATVDNGGDYGDTSEFAQNIAATVQTANIVIARETVDSDADGQIDQIRMTTSENLNDDFSGLTVTVAGYTVTGYSSDVANDNIFYVNLTESGSPDTGNTPLVTVTANTSLRDDEGINLVAPASIGWWDNNWLNRTRITFDNTASAENLTDFAVLVQLDSGNVDFGKIKAGGDDIRFIDDDGTELAYEIESWDDSGETANVWVKVQQIDQTSNSDFIWLYYNNASAADAQNASGVWDTNFQGVWHLHDDFLDSTSNNNDGTNSGSTDISGSIGDGQDFDGANDGIDLGTTAFVSNSWTLEFWVRPDNPDNYERIFIQGENASSTRQLQAYWHGDHIEVQTSDDGSNGNPQAATASIKEDDITWTHFTWTFDGSSHSLYVNGDTSSGTTTGSGVGVNGDSYIGLRNGSSSYWTGGIDEVRITNVARSADWVEAQYKSQTDTFNTFGIEETYSPVGVVATDKAGPVLVSASSPQSTGANLFQAVGQQLDLVFSETLTGAPSEMNLEAALVFAGGATDGDNLPTLGTGANPISLVTTSQTNDTLRVTFNTDNTANADWLRVGTHTVQVTDGTNLTDSASNTAETSAAAITITGDTNDAPVLDNTSAMTLTDITEDDTNPSGNTVQSIIDSAGGNRITDADAVPVEGIAVIGVDDTNGQWQYNTGSGWTAFGAVTNTNAVLLDTAASIRFVPTANYNGPAGNITFRAWDQTSGSNGQTGVDASTNGGTTSFSTDTETATLNINPVNDEESLDFNAGLTLDEGATGTITNAELATSDVDHTASQIIYTVDTAPANGTLSLNWVALTATDTFTQADIDAGLVRYRHDGGETTSDSFDFTVDDGMGTSTSATFNFTINPVNDAPVNMLSGQPQSIASSSVDGATDVHAADLDGDGDVDLVSTSWTDDTVRWFQNDGTGSFTEYTIATGVSGARHAFVADIDGDTHMDVLVSDYENDTVTWYENDGGATPTFTAHVITSSADGAWSSYAIDVDNDGDMDVLSASIWDGKVAWYENDGAAIPGWTEHVITTTADGVRTVVAGDLDGDGDIDVASASFVDDTIAWYESDGAATPGFTERIVTTGALGAQSIEIADVDSDGNLDLVTASYADGKIAWFHNDGAVDPTFSEQVISTAAAGARDVTTADMDGDGDLDILSASVTDNKFAWYENDGAVMPGFTERLVSQDGNGPRAVDAADIDGDGDIDVIGASISDDEVGYFENTDGQMGIQVTAEETPLVFDAAGNNLVWISDVDEGGLEMKVRLEITNGTISLSGLTGLTLDVGTGTDDGIVEFRGTITDINAALDGMTFTPTDNFNGVASIRILTDDQGNSGSGGALTDDDTINITVTPVNDSPAVATNTGMTINEGSTGNVITTAMLNEGDVDDDGADLIYTITNVTDNGTMYLAGFGALGLNDTFTQADIDAGDVTYDHNDSETTSDSFGFSLADGGEDGSTPAAGTFNITVTLVNDNSITAISDSDATADAVLENATVGTTVGVTAFADDADTGDSVTYSLDDNDGGRFAINSSTGVVTVAGAIDREADGATRSITVRATSTDTSSTTQVFVIAITDVDEFDVGSITDINLSSNAVDENATVGTLVGITASANDADATNNGITFSLQDDDGGRFTINSSTGVVTVAGAIDREADGASRNITVRATSDDGSFADQVFAIGINDLDEFDVGAVTDSDATANAVDENATVGTLVGIDVTASDADATNSNITYSLQDNDGGRFTINSSTGVVTVAGAIDREADGTSRNITVRATSDDGSFTDQIFAIGINDVDEFDVGAVTDTDATANAVDENATVGTLVGIDVTANDADATNNNITYSLQDNDGGRFTINSSTGVVTVAGAIDREADGASRNITVRATSDDGSFTDQVFAIAINDLDEFDVGAVTDTDATANAVDENATVGTLVGIDVTASDSDATNSNITYSLQDNDGGRFTINSSTGVVTVAGAIDREADGASRNITVRATSDDGSFTDQVFAIGINDIDEFDVGAVTDTDATANEVDENATVGTLVGIDVTASDSDATSSNITYSLQDNDGGRFTINSSTGVVTVAGAIDREADGASRNITVRATSDDGSFTDQVFAIAINDLDEFDVGAVTDTDATANAVDENATVGTLVGIDVSASDADATNSNITYSLQDDDGGRFTIHSSTGVVTVAGAIDREADGASRNITVRATSDDGSFTDQIFAIGINDLDEFDVGAVTDTDATANAVDENATVGTLVGIDVTASDADATNNNITYSLQDDDGGRFTINSSTGVVTVAGAIDREADGASRNITVRATSDDGSFTDQVFAIGINDLDEFDVGAVTDTNAATNEVAENSAVGTVVGVTASATDLDATNNTVTYSLQDNDGGRFAIDSNSGVVTVAGPIDLETDGPSRNITVRATSSDGSFTDQLFTININNVDEAPVLTTNNPLSVPEEGTRTITSAYLSSSDVDTPANQIVYTLTSLPGSEADVRLNGSNLGIGDTFTQDDIDNNRVTFRFDDDAYATSFNFTVGDGTTTSTEFTFGINGVQVNDAPIVTAPATTLNATEQIGLSIHGTGFSVTDVDEMNSGATATLSVGDGILTIAAGDSGITVNSGNNTSSVTISGTISEINDLLTAAGTGSITYLNNSDTPIASTTITVTVNDLGNSGIDPGLSGDGSSEEGTNSQLISITPVNDSPTVATNTGMTVTEGSTGNVITTAMLSEGDVDDDGAGLTYEITDVTDNGTIYLSGFGALGLNDTFTQADIDAGNVTYDHNDSETISDSFSFSLADGGEDGATPALGVFNITVTLVNDNSISAIADADAGADLVAENVAIGTTVGVTAFADDADTGDTVSYSLDDDDGGRFAINSATGVVTVAGPIDREADGATCSITVRATSSDTSTTTQVFVVAIADVDEFDVTTPIDSDATVNAVNENAATNTVVGVTALASDADATNNTITYSLDDAAGGRFKIDSVSGVVTVDNGTLLDREAAASHDITVRATSSDGSFDTAVMTINLIDIDEFDTGAVTDSDAAANEVNESAANGTVVGVTAQASDADVTDTISYSLDDDAGGRFTINTATGVITVADNSLLDYETTTSHNVTVRATSDDLSFSTAVFTINLLDDTSEAVVGAISDTNPTGDGLAENSLIGSAVGITANATDPDGTDTVAYSLDDDAGGRFAINATTGVVTLAGSIDAETATSHNITVRATSTDSSFSTAVFVIAVGDIDEFDVGPVTDSNGTVNAVDENAVAGTLVGITASASDTDVTTNAITYTLQDDDGGRFAINASTGVVTVAGAIDREADGASRNITVRATSADGSFTDQVFAIGINDLDEFDVGAVTDSDGTANAVDENAVVGTVVGVTATASDADATNNAITYSLQDDDGGRFAINASTGVVTVAGAIDREADGASRNVTVRATSADGSFTDQVFTIGINDLDEFDVGAVTDSDGAANAVDENAAIGTVVGVTASASDADATNNGITYSLQDDDGGRFAINSSTGVVTVAGAIDREADGASRNVTVRATSTDGSFTDQVFAIGINDLDEFDVGLVTDMDGSANTVNENAVVGTVVGITTAASDVDATTNAITYSLQDDDGGRFAINASTGVVTVAGAIDREADGASRNITVRATSADGSFTDQVFAIGIDDLDEFDVGAVTDSDGAANAVDENSAIGTVVGLTASASDGDATNNGITYSLQDNDGGRFAINSSTGVVTVAGAIDREADGASRNITVRATSADGSFTDQVFAIGINDLDEFDVGAVTDSDGTANAVDENAVVGTAVGIIASAADADATNSNITYSLQDDDGGRFTINASTGAVTVAGAIDREADGASRNITVRATSADGSFTDQVFAIGINDLDEFDVGPVSDTDAAANTVDENAAVGTVVGLTASASDDDATTNAITYSLQDNDGGRFAINATTGVVTVAGAIDREADGASRNITVRATSADGSFTDQVFAIGINDLDESDVGAVTDSDVTANAVDENAAVGTIVGLTASAFDADATNNGISYSLQDNDGGRFAINSSTGVVTVAGSIDREADGASRNITVRATSTDGSFTDQVFAIGINDVDEFDVGPVSDTDGTANTVDENAIVGTVVGITASASDVDATTNAITYSLQDNDGGRFAINASTGVVTVAGAIDREADGASRNITVRATSADGSFTDQVFAIGINDLDEFDVGTVTDSDGTANAVDENAAVGTVVGLTASASDGDATNNGITYSLQDNDGGRFAINSSTGLVTVAGAIDREADGASRNITVRATSTDGSFTDQVSSIGINDVDEFDVGPVSDTDGTANTVDENAVVGTVVGITASASDVDATTNAITYSLQDNDGGRFAINAGTGVVTVAGAIDREADGASRNITVRATSADGSFTEQVFAIGINDLDEFDVGAVTDSDGTANAVDENAAVGTVVGLTASASDGDATNNGITYSLQDNDGGRFAINSSTGVVTLAGAIDREADGASRNITVRATSTDGSFTDQVFTIGINDLDEFDVGPVTDTDAAANTVDENAVVGTVVGITASASDADATTNAITYSLQDNDGGRFAINASTGVVTVAGAIDREADGSSRNITVRATSADGSFTDQVFAIGINDLDEFDVGAVTDIDGAVNAVDENAAVGTVVGLTASASDADATNNGITYSLQDNDGGRFAINSSTGVVTVAGAIDREADGASRNITVRATSADGSFTDQVFAIGINDLDEFDVGAVTDSDATANAVDENAAVGTVVGVTASASDADATTNAITYTLQDDDGGRFAIMQVLARQVVLAIPPRVIAGQIEFEPALPAAILHELQAIPTWMAAHAKLFAVYEAPFWRTQGLSGDGISRRGPLMEIHDASPATPGPGALFGFVGLAVDSPLRETSRLKAEAVQQLERMYGAPAATPVEVVVQDWSRERYNGHTSRSTHLTASSLRHAARHGGAGGQGPAVRIE